MSDWGEMTAEDAQRLPTDNLPVLGPSRVIMTDEEFMDLVRRAAAARSQRRAPWPLVLVPSRGK